MSVYANFRHIPEMQAIPAAQRTAVWRSFLQAQGYLSRETFLAFTPLVLSGLAAVLCLARIGPLLSLLLLLSGVPALCFTYVTLMRRPFRKYLDKTFDS
jgi:hypothetical protein